MAKNQRDFRQFPVERLGVLWPSHVASSPQAFGWGESKSRSSCGVPGLNMPQPMSKILEMYTECVGNVLEMCPLKLILASWKGLGMQWFVYECVLAYYVSIKFLKFPTWTGWHRWHTVTYGDYGAVNLQNVLSMAEHWGIHLARVRFWPFDITNTCTCRWLCLRSKSVA